jgi:hypothetical protein
MVSGIFITGNFGYQKKTVELFVFQFPSGIVIDGKTIARYELHIFNNTAHDISLKNLQILNGKGGNILEMFDSLQLSVISGKWHDDIKATDPCIVPASSKAVVYLDLQLKVVSDVRELLHSLSYVYRDSQAKKNEVKMVTITGAPIDVLKGQGLILGAPVKGNSWAAVYDPAWVRGHRRVMFRFEGKPYIPARFAIDFVKLDSLGHYAKGSQDTVGNWFGHGLEVLAVADGVVASVRDDFAESFTVSAHPGYDSSKATGNYVSIDIGNKAFAFYEHLKPNSIRVKPGQHVKKGEVIALLGFTGQSTGPHLHFHVANRNAPLEAEGVPYVFEKFRFVGFYQDFSRFGNEPWNVSKKGRITVRNQIPGPNIVVDFNDKP